ncbi:MAG: cobalamin biosynthesis protein [Pseudomonadota bacterium]
MKVAGFGFRRGAKLESLLAALDAAGGPAGLSAIATVTNKAETDVFLALADHLALPIEAVATDALSSVVVATRSEKSNAMYGTGSLSEAAALIAAGPMATLLSPRAISADSMATCAIAEVTA